MTASEEDTLPLPLALDEIDLPWLAAALPHLDLRAFEIVDVIHGTCTKLRIRLHVAEASRGAGIPEQVILKGGFEAHSRSLPYMHRAEVRAYREVLPVLKLPSPACHFAGFSPATGQGIVIMEDLLARDVEFCHPLHPQRRDQVARRLTELARFHARTWGSPELEPGGRWEWLEPIVPEQGGHLRQFLSPELWTKVIDLPRGRAASVRFHDLGWMLNALDRLFVLAGRLPHALLHGDTHLGNLYIDADGTPGFFDSLPHRWPAIAEVAYHVTCALDTADRRGWERGLVEHYLAEVARCGVEPPAPDEAMRQYAAFLAYGYCIFVINDAGFQPEAVNTAYTARFSTAMIDNRTADALRSIT